MIHFLYAIAEMYANVVYWASDADIRAAALHQDEASWFNHLRSDPDAILTLNPKPEGEPGMYHVERNLEDKVFDLIIDEFGCFDVHPKDGEEGAARAAKRIVELVSKKD